MQEIPVVTFSMGLKDNAGWCILYSPLNPAESLELIQCEDLTLLEWETSKEARRQEKEEEKVMRVDC